MLLEQRADPPLHVARVAGVHEGRERGEDEGGNKGDEAVHDLSPLRGVGDVPGRCERHPFPLDQNLLPIRNP